MQALIVTGLAGDLITPWLSMDDMESLHSTSDALHKKKEASYEKKLELLKLRLIAFMQDKPNWGVPYPPCKDRRHILHGGDPACRGSGCLVFPESHRLYDTFPEEEDPHLLAAKAIEREEGTSSTDPLLTNFRASCVIQAIRLLNKGEGKYMHLARGIVQHLLCMSSIIEPVSGTKVRVTATLDSDFMRYVFSHVKKRVLEECAGQEMLGGWPEMPHTFKLLFYSLNHTAGRECYSNPLFINTVILGRRVPKKVADAYKQMEAGYTAELPRHEFKKPQPIRDVRPANDPYLS